jgi:hypothetical protein
MDLSVQDTRLPVWGAARLGVRRPDDGTLATGRDGAGTRPDAVSPGASATGWAPAPAATYTPAAVTGPTSEDFRVAARWTMHGSLPASVLPIAGVKAQDRPRWIAGADAAPDAGRQAGLTSALRLAAFKRDAVATTQPTVADPPPAPQPAWWNSPAPPGSSAPGPGSAVLYWRFGRP